MSFPRNICYFGWHKWKPIKLTNVATTTVLFRCAACGKERDRALTYEQYLRIFAEVWKHK